MNIFAISENLFFKLLEKASNTKLVDFIASVCVSAALTAVVSVLLYFELNFLAFVSIFTSIITIGVLSIKYCFENNHTLYGYHINGILVREFDSSFFIRAHLMDDSRDGLSDNSLMFDSTTDESGIEDDLLNASDLLLLKAPEE